MFLNPDAFDCGNCDCNENYEVGYYKWTIDDVLGEPLKSKKCLRQTIDETSYELWRLYLQYEKGNLVYSGGVYDQPAKYLEAMSVIDARVNRIRQQRLQNGKP